MYVEVWLVGAVRLTLPLFGASYHADSTLSFSPPCRKHGSITPLTSAAISHLDTRVIQLAVLTLLACLPPFSGCLVQTR